MTDWCVCNVTDYEWLVRARRVAREVFRCRIRGAGVVLTDCNRFKRRANLLTLLFKVRFVLNRQYMGVDASTFLYITPTTIKIRFLICRVSIYLSKAIYWKHGKTYFDECYIRHNKTLDEKCFCQEPNARHTVLGKNGSCYRLNHSISKEWIKDSGTVIVRQDHLTTTTISLQYYDGRRKNHS